jgi:hypothetical protein
VSDSGLVTCAALGTSVISVLDEDTGITSTATGSDATVVCAGQVVAIRVDPPIFDLFLGKSKQMRAYRVFENGSELDVTRKVLWSSSEESVVSIEPQGDVGGRATGVDAGQAKLIAFDEPFGISSNDPGGTNGVVNVLKIRKSLAIFPEAGASGFVSGSVGETMQFKAKVTYQGGATEGVNAEVTWSSSNTNVATISNGTDGLNSGRATLKTPGQTIITATWPGDGVSPTLTDTVGLQVLP